MGNQVHITFFHGRLLKRYIMPNSSLVNFLILLLSCANFVFLIADGGKHYKATFFILGIAITLIYAIHLNLEIQYLVSMFYVFMGSLLRVIL